MNRYKHKTTKYIFNINPQLNYLKEGPCDDFCKEHNTKKYLYHLKKDKSISNEDLLKYISFLENLGFKGDLIKKDINLKINYLVYTLSEEHLKNLNILINFLIEKYLITYDSGNGKKQFLTNELSIPKLIKVAKSYSLLNYIRNIYITRGQSIGSFRLNGIRDLLTSTIYLYIIKYAVRSKEEVISYNFVNNKDFANIIINKTYLDNRSFNLYLLQLLRYVKRHPKIVKKILYLNEKHPNFSSWDILYLVHTQAYDNNHNEYYDSFYKIKKKIFFKKVSLERFKDSIKFDSIVNSMFYSVKAEGYKQHFLYDIYNLKENVPIEDTINDLLLNKLIYIGETNEYFIKNNEYIPEKITKKSYGFLVSTTNNKIILKSKKLFKKNLD